MNTKLPAFDCAKTKAGPWFASDQQLTHQLFMS
jgi:hypothetical protein